MPTRSVGDPTDEHIEALSMDVQAAGEDGEKAVARRRELSTEGAPIEVVGRRLHTVRDHLGRSRCAEATEGAELDVGQCDDQRRPLEHPAFEQDPVRQLAPAASAQGYGVVPAVWREHVRAQEYTCD